MLDSKHAAARGSSQLATRGRRLLAVAASGTLLLVSGCTGSHGARPVTGAAHPAAAATAQAGLPDRSLVANLTLPVLAYIPSANIRQQVTAAEGVVAARCLLKYGLHWSPNRPTSAAAPASELDREYGISDPQAARRYGYHLPPGHDYNYRLAVPRSGPVASALQGLDSADHVVTSIAGRPLPKDGCLGQARAQVGGPALEDLTADTVLLAASKQANSDPRVLALFGQWSDCMAAAGFRYPDPLTAIGSSQWTQGKEVTSAEQQTALADVACKYRVQLLPKWVAVESSYEQALIARDSGPLTATIRAWNQAGAHARVLLAGR